MSRSVVVRSCLCALILAVPGVVVSPYAARADGCRYRTGPHQARVHTLPYRGAAVVGVLPAGRSARGACGRVWNGDHEWTRLDQPVSGYVVSGRVRRS